MRIVITGAQGQLGTDLRQTLRGHQLTALDLPMFDLTDPPVRGPLWMRPRRL